MSSKFTKKALVKEIIHCGKDPIYFINTYAKIEKPGARTGLVAFNTRPYQNDIIDAYLNNRRNIILKARQLGITTITAAYITWLILFHRNRNVLVVGTKQEVAKNTVRIVKTIMKHLPKWLIISSIDVNNRNSIELSNGSRVKAVTTSTDVGRSEALSLLFVDECAWIDKMDDIWTGLSPTIATGGSVILASTPRGTGNFFHKTFEKSRDGENEFNCKLGTYTNPGNSRESYDDRLMWWVNDEYDEDWFYSETVGAGKTPREVAQEFLCNFNASGDTFIWHEDIEKMEQVVSEPSRRFPLDRNIWIWDEPVLNATYLISVDISRGDAQDYSAFHVLRLDTTPLLQVAEYKGKVKPDLLGTYLVSMAKYYNNATIAPENNSGWSGQTILKIQEHNYPFLHYSRQRKSKFKSDREVDPYYAQLRNDYLPGYAVTSANRLEMLAKMEQYIRLGDIRINSPRTVSEFKSFIVNDHNKPIAQRGYTDDLVMALAGGLYVRDQAFIHSYRDNEMTIAMLSASTISITKTQHYVDFAYGDRSKIREHVNEQNKLYMADGSEIDLNWLLDDFKPIYKG